MTRSTDGRSGRSDATATTRRRFLGTLVGTGSAAVLAGCGGRGAARNDTTPTARPTTTTGASTASEGTTTSAPEPPDIYAGLLDSREVDAIRTALRAGRDPWKTGYRVQIRDADRALDATPRSVVDNGAPEGVDKHRFATGDDRSDYKAALRMSTWIRDLGVAYAFNGKDQYARKAIDLLRHWFVAPETRMYPSGRDFGDRYFSIELHITIPTMIYGASMVRGHPYWEQAGGETALREWIRSYLRDMEAGRDENGYSGVVKNNIYAWWIFARCAAASYLDDREALRSGFDDWRANALDQIQPNGLLKLEKQREDGLAYSLYGLTALTLTAEVARHYGVDLYTYHIADDSGVGALQRVFQAYATYVKSSDGWEWGVGDNGYTTNEREAGASIYELANSMWPKSTYESVIEAVERPLYERRILGWTTLTHANRFALDLDREI